MSPHGLRLDQTPHGRAYFMHVVVSCNRVGFRFVSLHLVVYNGAMRGLRVVVERIPIV